MLKLKHQYFGHLMCRANSLEKSLKLGKIENRRRGGDRWLDGCMASSTLWTWAWANPGWDNEGQGNLSCCIPWGHKKLDRTEWLNNNFCFLTGTYHTSLYFLLSEMPLVMFVSCTSLQPLSIRGVALCPCHFFLCLQECFCTCFCQSHSCYRNGGIFSCLRASLVAQLVKNLPAMGETCVRFLGWEDPLKKGKAIHSSILPWSVPWTV